MKRDCEKPLPVGEILDYLSGDLSEANEQELESHLFRCASCSSEAELLAGLRLSVAVAMPPVLSSSRFAALEREGRVASVNVMSPGQIVEVMYPESGRVLVHRLRGIDLSGAHRVDLDVSASSGEVLWHLEDIAFDAEHGEILVPCQRHFADSFPRDIVFSVALVSGKQDQEVARYTVRHRLA